jgi:hypothetical protein
MAPPHRGEMIVASVCPLFHFVGVSRVTISDLIIDCQGTSDIEAAPALFFESSASLTLELSNLMAYGWARATVLVRGGIFNVVPPTVATALYGSAANVSVSRTGRYIDAQAIVIGDFTGVFNVSGLANFTELTISPASGGSVWYPPYARLDITNMAVISNIEGTPITSEFNTNGDQYGFTSTEENNVGWIVARWMAIAFIFQAALALVLHQDLYARYKDKTTVMNEGSSALEDAS